MGLFSIFKGKKNGQPVDPAAFPDTRLLRGETTRMPGDSDEDRARQREIARATALKIDAIEQAMASDIFDNEPAWGHDRPRGARLAASNDGSHPTLPMEELATTQLIGEDDLPESIVEAQNAPLAEEVALIWASGETELARHMLQGGLGTERTPWWMLFDLYQIAGDQAAFDDLAIDYASRFETSPPTWKPLAQGAGAVAGVTPTEAFSGRLDASVEPQVERLLRLDGKRLRVRLEFERVTDFDEAGCAAVLSALQSLRARRAELVLSGAPHLISLLRTALAVGVRDPGQAPWLLLLELQLLSNSEKAFEETAMDYCVTFEVSPPSFEQPAGVETAADAPARAATGDRFLLPATITGNRHELLDQVDVYIAQYDPAVLDCSHLVRVDYEAAGQLLNRLRPLAEARRIELRDMNHLVAALFRLVGFSDVIRMFPHKY